MTEEEQQTWDALIYPSPDNRTCDNCKWITRSYFCSNKEAYKEHFIACYNSSVNMSRDIKRKYDSYWEWNGK